MSGEGAGRSKLVYLTAVFTVYATQLATFPKHHLNRVPVKFVETKLLEFDLLPRKHAVVIDAGSTGSRVLAFSFYTSVLNGDSVLFDELWHEEKPGLSSLSPEQAAQSVQKLVQLAKDRIHDRFWSSTPISLKATAGLRLLPEEKSTAIINSVKEVLKSSGFHQLPSDPGVEIMSDLEEGICGWMTVNFLLDLVGSVEESAAALDLGGGSTQISFQPTWTSTKLESPDSYVVKKNIGGVDNEIYSHSYLGLGLMAARKAIIKESKTIVDGKELARSSCFTKEVIWTQKDGDYKVEPGQKTGFDECHAHVSKFITNKGVHSPEELKTRTLVAFSYFYDRAVESGILTPEGGVLEVKKYKEAAKKWCSDASSDFLCFDLTFMYSLLRTYGLTDSHDLHVYKKINGHETSWALGLALQMLP